MPSSRWMSWWWLALIALAVVPACGDEDGKKRTDDWVGVCIDEDQDGYGVQCAQGSDCDDSDSSVHSGCAKCTKPNEGCDCPADAAPVECSVTPELTKDGSLLCKEGMRYCRDLKWSGCEGITTFEAPPPSKHLNYNALISADAGAVACSPCEPSCFRIDDALGVVFEGGVPGSNVTGSGGGITLVSGSVDGGTMDAGLLDDGECIPFDEFNLTDDDCDGIPNDYDPYPAAPPFASDHSTIFMDLPPGTSGQETFEIQFFLNSADVYFYVDMTASMEGERDNLVNDLTSGSFLTGASATAPCSDANLNGVEDPEEAANKAGGIAGNIACLIRDVQLGAGYFRDIPFPGPNGYGTRIAPYDFQILENVQDITSDVLAVRNAITTFQTRGNYNAPEGSMQGLWSLATGEELYAGWDRPGIPKRLGCPVGTQGYPCFRSDAVPIVIHITDAPIQNGPSFSGITTVGGVPMLEYNSSYGTGTPLNYDTATLDDMTSGTEKTYRQLAAGAGESFGDAEYVGVIDNVLVTYVGDTRKMTSDVTYNDVGICPSGQYAWSTTDQTSKDAAFRFEVQTGKTLTVSARGSQYDTTLLVTRSDAIGSYTLPVPAANNGTIATAQPVPNGATPLSAGVNATVTGTTVGHPEVFTRESLSCMTTSDAEDRDAASVVTFQLAEDLPLRIAGRANSTNSTYRVTSALFAGATQAPVDHDLRHIYCAGNPTVVNDYCNDRFGDFNIGDLHTGSVTTNSGSGNVTRANNGYVRLINGTTANSAADYPADGFVQGGCSDLAYKVAGTQKDAVVDFSLSKPTRLRVESLGLTKGSLSTGWDHALAVVERPATIEAIQQYNPVNNESAAQTDGATYSAELYEDDVLAVPTGGWVQYVGNSLFSTNNYTRSQVTGGSSVCQSGATGPADTTKDVALKFVVTKTQADGTPYSFDFDTFPTNPQYGYTTYLSLHRGVPDTLMTLDFNGKPTAVLDDHNLTDGAGQAVLTAVQGAIDYRRVILTGMDIRDNDRTMVPNSAATGTGCGNNTGSTNGGRDALYRFRVDNTIPSLRIRTTSDNGSLTGSPDFKSFVSIYRGTIDAAGLVSGDCTNPGSSVKSYEKTLTNVVPGDYYVLIKEWQYASSMGTNADDHGLIIEDARYADASFIGCDVGSHPNSSKYSKITRSLAPGTYYIVIKGQPASGSPNELYGYQLNVRPTPPTQPIIACVATPSRNNKVEVWDPQNPTALLPPGNYSVVIRGLSTSSHSGSYAISLRDMDLAPDPIACHNTAAGVPAITQTLPALGSDGQPITYHLVMRANQAPASYSMVINDIRASTVACADDNAVPKDSGGSSSNLNAEVTQYFDPGEYVAVVKGYAAGGDGRFQLSLGDPALETAGSFEAKRWLGPAGDGVGGIRETLVQRGIRVITVHSGSNSTTVNQSKAISSETGALSKAGTPLTFYIDSSGNGMGAAVIDAVNLLAGNLSMDVTARLKEEPEDPTPNFGFKVEAIVASNSCTGTDDTDGDGVPDTHLQCKPGATPRFRISITNRPPPNNVPTNPADPNGGWNMKLQLIGDDTYVVDEIPVYIIPEDVVPDPPTEVFAETGIYEQEAKAIGCMGTESPQWKSLYWNATIPSGTKITWQLCGGDTDAELASCTWKTAGIVQSGGTCADGCENGYCDTASNACHYVTGPSCTTTSDCGANSVCVSNTCLWTANPIDLKPALALGLQGKDRMKVRVILQSNSNRSRAPTIHDWRLDYLCTAQE